MAVYYLLVQIPAFHYSHNVFHNVFPEPLIATCLCVTGTSACPESKFYCRNMGDATQFLYSSRVNDHICGAYAYDMNPLVFFSPKSPMHFWLDDNLSYYNCFFIIYICRLLWWEWWIWEWSPMPKHMSQRSECFWKQYCHRQSRVQRFGRS